MAAARAARQAALDEQTDAWKGVLPPFIVGRYVSGANDAALAEPPGTVWSSGADWSNDGTRLLVFRGFTPGLEDVRPAVVPADGSSMGIEIDRRIPIVQDCCSFAEWAPDDSTILVTPVDAAGRPGQQLIIDPLTGETRVAPWDTTSDPTWQRLAP